MQPRDKIIPWYFVMFFAFIALVNGAMVTTAIKTYPGITTENPYEKGLAYNKVIQAQEQQEALGWKADIRYENGYLQFNLRDRNDKNLPVDKATATFTRPTQSGMDFVVELSNETPVNFPLKGLWEVRVDAYYNNIHHQKIQRIIAP